MEGYLSKCLDSLLVETYLNALEIVESDMFDGTVGQNETPTKTEIPPKKPTKASTNKVAANVEKPPVVENVVEAKPKMTEEQKNIINGINLDINDLQINHHNTILKFLYSLYPQKSIYFYYLFGFLHNLQTYATF